MKRENEGEKGQRKKERERKRVIEGKRENGSEVKRGTKSSSAPRFNFAFLKGGSAIVSNMVRGVTMDDET